MAASTPREPFVSPLAREPELEPRPGPRSPLAHEQAWARCDRPGFEGGVSFWDFYEANRREDLIEPASGASTASTSSLSRPRAARPFRTRVYVVRRRFLRPTGRL
jgi:hypothetical protein